MDELDLRHFLQASSPVSAQFWLLTVFLSVVFFTGGASRIDVTSLLILRPFSVLACTIALVSLRREHMVGRLPLIVGFGAIVGLTTLHIIPLPPALWQALPGRQLQAEIGSLVSLGEVWRPLTLAPIDGFHALASLSAPLAVLLFGIQLGQNDLCRLLPLLIGFGALSGFLGVLQVNGDEFRSLYFYSVTNFGNPVGLFANRNHAALLLASLFPMLTAFVLTRVATAPITNLFVAVSLAILLVPLILLNGSRSALMVTSFGMVGCVILYLRSIHLLPRIASIEKPTSLILLILFAVAIITWITIYFSRAKSIDRLFELSAANDGRRDFWTLSLSLAKQYFPWGSGSGSFAETYQIVEPLRLLEPLYLNHAHNDWIEVMLTFGFPGVLLMFVATIYFLWRLFPIWQKSIVQQSNLRRQIITYGRMSSITIAMVGAASVTDYPLRTPIMMCVLAVWILWFLEADRAIAFDMEGRVSALAR